MDITHYFTQHLIIMFMYQNCPDILYSTIVAIYKIVKIWHAWIIPASNGEQYGARYIWNNMFDLWPYYNIAVVTEVLSKVVAAKLSSPFNSLCISLSMAPIGDCDSYAVWYKFSSCSKCSVDQSVTIIIYFVVRAHA